MRRVHPEPQAELTDEELGSLYAFPTEGRWIRANMVSTLDGAMRGPDGGSRSINTAADQRVFSIARLAADVTLVGAGTIRAEDYRPSLRPIAIVTSRLDLPLTLRLFAERTDAHPRPLVMTTAEAAGRAPEELATAADLIPCGSVSVDLALVIEELVERGLKHINCEGGPGLLGDLAAAGLLDELLLTLSPALLGGGPSEHILNVTGGLQPALRLTTAHVLSEDGTVLIRARRA